MEEGAEEVAGGAADVGRDGGEGLLPRWLDETR